MIGQYYKYQNTKQKFKLIDIVGFMYIFECGHRVTDNVFIDMVRCNPPSSQLKINL